VVGQSITATRGRCGSLVVRHYPQLPTHVSTLWRKHLGSLEITVPRTAMPSFHLCAYTAVVTQFKQATVLETLRIRQ
jgi:hypothetical protein